MSFGSDVAVSKQGVTYRMSLFEMSETRALWGIVSNGARNSELGSLWVHRDRDCDVP